MDLADVRHDQCLLSGQETEKRVVRVLRQGLLALCEADSALTLLKQAQPRRREGRVASRENEIELASHGRKTRPPQLAPVLSFGQNAAMSVSGPFRQFAAMHISVRQRKERGGTNA